MHKIGKALTTNRSSFELEKNDMLATLLWPPGFHAPLNTFSSKMESLRKGLKIEEEG